MGIKLNPFTGNFDLTGNSSGGGGSVDSFNGRTGAVVPQAGDYSADQITYDNTSSGLAATDVQAAIDELAPAIVDGNPNTIAFYDAAGDLSSSTNAKLDITTASIAFGTGGTFVSNANGSLSHGTNENNGTIEASGSGSISYGRTAQTSTITANSIGSSAYGSAISAATILAAQTGAIASGHTSGTLSNITAEGVASFARGSATSAGGNAGEIHAFSPGSMAFGRANAGNIASSGEGSLAIGRVNAPGVGATISSEASGSLAGGFSQSGAEIIASGNGSLAFGSSSNNGILSATGLASFVLGSADGLEVNASGTGAIAIGAPQVSDIIASGRGSLAMGDDTITTADYGMSFGLGLRQDSYLGVSLGRFATVPPNNPTSWISTDPLFVLGNGADDSNRNNAFQVDKDGTLYINDPSLGSAAAGYVWTLQNDTTGEGAWKEAGSSVSYEETLVANTLVDTEVTTFTAPLNASVAYGAIIDYSMLSDTGDVRMGRVDIAFNVAGTTSVRNDTYLETVPLSVTLNVTISGGNLRLVYTNPDPTNNVALTAHITLIN